jgi:hypothetical protein
MFRSHLARILVIASLGISCGCLCSGNHPLLDRFRNRGECCPQEGCCCGEVAGFPQDGPVLQDAGPYPAAGVPTGCPTLVPQGTPFPPLSSPPGIRIEPRPATPEPYRPMPG